MRVWYAKTNKTIECPIIDEGPGFQATAGTGKHMELVTWLKDEHGMGHGHANALVAVYLAER